METILTNTARIGNFTSSEIWKLTTNPTAKAQKEGEVFGAPALTYILEKNMEREFGRSIDSETQARPLSWGKVCEKYVSENGEFLPIGEGYSVNMDKTTVHPLYNFWAGSEDATKEDTVVDFKCPMTLKSFYLLVSFFAQTTSDDECYSGNLAIQHIRDNHPDGEKFFWQLVSNSCIHDKKYAELIVFCPYQSELNAIREVASNYDAENLHPYQWISYAHDEELPYLLDGGKFRNFNVIRFEIPQADKDFLTERVKLAAEKLIKT